MLRCSHSFLSFRCPPIRSPFFRPHLSRFLTSHGDEEPTFTFAEEPLGLPAEAGYGFFQGAPHDVLGPDARFQLQVKLGYGTNSSVWLAKDRQVRSHVALKILSGYASRLNAKRNLRELEIHQRLASLSPEESGHCSRLVTHFIHKGIEQDGDHLCLALELEQATLEAVWREHNVNFYPISIVKRILRHMLHGIAAVHKCGIAHTDIKPDNIMVGLSPVWTTDAIDSWVDAHSPRVYEPCQSLDKVITQAFVSQPLPIPTVRELETCDFKLADFSNVQEVGDATTDEITPLTLRPPEVILGGPWNEKVDIWTFGCLVFTVLTRLPLFPEGVKPIHHEYLRSGVDLDAEGIDVDYVLWLMAVITDQRFPPAVFPFWPNSLAYFEKNGEMKRFSSIPRRPIETCIRDSGCPASEGDVAGASALMRRCLRFNPSERPSALELLQDPWLKKVQSV